MKKNRLILSTLLMSVICLASYAQGRPFVPKLMETKFGVKAGANLSTISNGLENIDFSPAMKAGFHLGVVANLHFGYRDEGAPAGTGWFGLQPELLYSRQGFAVGGEAISFDYLSLPIMAKLYVTENFNIEAGPYFAYLLGVSPNSTVIEGAQINLSVVKGGFDMGVGFGLGYEMKMGLTLGARYALGLSGMDTNLPWKNNVLSISAGWLF
ncbi:MAG: PorT family protein [Tannerellaceae bacterium]|jgi:hypothetical protein|nr:PorT family protein [Tannerellaceae bacterium]